MANKQEKILLGLNEDATDEQIEARISDLVNTEKLFAEAPSVPAAPAQVGKIALISRGPSTRRGTYMIPSIADAPIVLDLATIEPRDLGELEGDGKVLKLRSDSPLTPLTEVGRYRRS